MNDYDRMSRNQLLNALEPVYGYVANEKEVVEALMRKEQERSVWRKILLLPLPFVAVLAVLGLIVYRVDGTPIDWPLLAIACVFQYAFSAALAYKILKS